jgi:uncharacterized protein (DUF427 family)
MSTYRATWHDAVLAESDATVVVDGYRYFPADSVRSEHLAANSHHSVCPWKGQASYYDVVVDGEVNANAAWYYPEPRPAARAVAGRIAFWRGVKVARLPGADDARDGRTMLGRLRRRLAG